MSCNTYHLTWVSLTLGVGISSWLLQQGTALLLALDEGYLLTAAVPDLQCGIALHGGSWWRGLRECGPLEKGMASHFNILALRTP